jgi:hypothetical protein
MIDRCTADSMRRLLPYVSRAPIFLLSSWAFGSLMINGVMQACLLLDSGREVFRPYRRVLHAEFGHA